MRKCAGILIVFRAFSNEERFKMAPYWEGSCGSYYVHVPRIQLILESCMKARIRTPEFIGGADSVKVVFHFLPAERSISDEEKIMALFSMKREVKLSDVEDCLSVSRNTATRKLNKLIQSEKIRREGSGPAVRYFLC